MLEGMLLLVRTVQCSALICLKFYSVVSGCFFPSSAIIEGCCMV
jgi:hypothetical protein